MRQHGLLLQGLVASAALAAAQTIVNPTTAAPSATAIPTGSHGYTYAGCWNETVNVANSGGARALSGGNYTADNTMTIDGCLDYCGGGTQQYAGLEYGRECYCGAYLSVLSQKLNDSECNFACDGNASEICGGTLTLTLYNLTDHSKKTGVAGGSSSGGVAWYAAAAGVGLVVAAFL